MSLPTIGEISEINRYPVKSLAGERLASCKLESYGLYGDRCYAFIDETKEGWDAFFTAREIPEMLAYQAKLIGEGSENEYPQVIVTSPEGRSFGWNEDLLADLQRYTKRKMSMSSYETQTKGLKAVDAAGILIVTDSSLRKLETIWGKGLDNRRFRANLVVSLSNDRFEEGGWIGKRLSIGGAELQIDSYCERCSMITIDPDTLERDPSLLRKVNEQMDLHFGVYASVVKTGQVRVGDKVQFVE
jgi:uncharacterized protein YcbX